MDDQMFSTRTLPWMKLGTSFDEPLTPAEAVRAAGLDWEVELRPLMTVDRHGQPMEVPTRRATVRTDTDQVLGTVGTSYQPWQNHEAFDFLTGLVDDPDTAIIEAAGSVSKGRQAFVVVRLPNGLDDVADGDPHELYLVVRTGHDGTKAVEVLVMPLRSLCMNMLGLASFGRNAVQRWSIPHTLNMREKISCAQETLTRADVYASEFKQTAERLAAVDIEERRLRELLDRALPDRPSRPASVEDIIERFHRSPTIPDRFRATGWGALSAVTEHMDWGRPRVTDSGRYHGGISGVAAQVRNRTAALLLAGSR